MHHAEPVVLLLVLMAVLVIVAHKSAIPYPVLLVLGGLVAELRPGPSGHSTRSQSGPVLLSSAPPLSRGALHFVAGFPAQPARDSFSRHRPRPHDDHRGRVGGAYLHRRFALGGGLCPRRDRLAARRRGGGGDSEASGVPTRIQAVLGGESLVNDATALVAYQFAVAAMVTGQFSLGEASLRFLLVGLGGVGLGLLVGLVMRWVQGRLDDPPVQITISLLTPFAAYLLAERLQVSGVLAVVAAGMYLGWHATALSARTRLQAQAFWEMAAFFLNGFIFIMIGLQLPGILRNLSHEPLSRLIGLRAPH